MLTAIGLSSSRSASFFGNSKPGDACAWRSWCCEGRLDYSSLARDPSERLDAAPNAR